MKNPNFLHVDTNLLIEKYWGGHGHKWVAPSLVVGLKN